MKPTQGPDFYQHQMDSDEFDEIVVEEECKQSMLDDEIMVDSENFDEAPDEILYDPQEYQWIDHKRETPKEILKKSTDHKLKQPDKVLKPQHRN